MPPKGAKKDAPSKKTDQKQKAKVIEDKTFGLKNKKGAKQQRFVEQVKKQVQTGGLPQKARAAQLEAEKQREAAKKKKTTEDLNALLFRPVEQKVAKGVDPKSVLCIHFKQGLCTKGDKCKFSHDINIGRKGEKRNIYEDEAKEDGMDDWDEAKLEEVVNKKHGDQNKSLPKTSIICKYFLDAVENNKYGWFWQCPNGTNCHYRHALPPGFVLKKDKKKEDKTEEISLEDLIEKERAALSSDNLTKVTLESFLKWKDRKKREKLEKMMAEKDRKKADFKAGKVLGISGREMFEFNPDMALGDDDEADDVVYHQQNDEEEMEAMSQNVRELTLEALAASATYNPEGAATVVTERKFEVKEEAPAAAAGGNPEKTKEDEMFKLDEAAALPNPSEDATNEAIAAAMAATVNGLDLAGDTPIDEDLFDGEDLDIVEDELETLDLEN